MIVGQEEFGVTSKLLSMPTALNMMESFTTSVILHKSLWKTCYYTNEQVH